MDIFNFLPIQDCVRIKLVNKNIARLAISAMARQEVVKREYLMIIMASIIGLNARDFDYIKFLEHLRDVKYLGLFELGWPSSVTNVRRARGIRHHPYDALFLSQRLANIESFGCVHAEDIDVIFDYATHLKESGKPVKIKIIEVGSEKNHLCPPVVRDWSLKMTKLVELCPAL